MSDAADVELKTCANCGRRGLPERIAAHDC